MVGKSFTCETVRAKLTLLLAAPSLTVIVMLAAPTWLVAGVMVVVRLAPLPPKTILATGTSVGLDEAALRVKLVSRVSTSATVIGIANEVSSFTVWFGI